MESLDLKELCAQLKWADRNQKIIALKKVAALFSSNEDGMIVTPIHELGQIFDEVYQSLIDCYSDRFESVRETATELVTKFLEYLPSNDVVIVKIILILMDRMGHDKILEQSEEVRLLNIRQLLFVVRKCCQLDEIKVLQENCYKIVCILCNCVKDTFPTIKLIACETIVTLAVAVKNDFNIYAEYIVNAVAGLQTHKHLYVRIAVVNVFGRMALHVSGNALIQLLKNIYPLLMDPVPKVRQSCGEMGVLLAKELSVRYSHFDNIIPLILCCLMDDSTEVINNILPQWEACGLQYYQENEADLNNLELADNLYAANYQHKENRPSIGCRALVRSSLGALNEIIRDINDWKEIVRLHSMKLLYQVTFHAEASLSTKFVVLYPEVSRACMDFHQNIAIEAVNVAKLMGALFPYDNWFQHALIGLEKNPNRGYLTCFFAMYNNTTECRFLDSVALVNVLVKPCFSHSTDLQFQCCVLHLMYTLFAKITHENDRKTVEQQLYINIYCTVIKLMAIAKELYPNVQLAEDLVENGEQLLQQLANGLQITIGKLHELHFNSALSYVNVDVVPREDGICDAVGLLSGLLKIAQFRATYMKPLQERILGVWENCLHEDRTKIFCTLNAVLLNWRVTMGTEVSLNKSTKLLSEFLVAIFEQHFEWHVGAQASVMRSLCAAAICSISTGAPEESSYVLSKHVAKYMVALLEDQSSSTRYYATKSLCNFGPMCMEDLCPIGYAVLQRLNDISSDIRELAAIALVKLVPEFETIEQVGDANYNTEQNLWLQFIQEASNVLFLYFLDGDERLQNASKLSIIQLHGRYPAIMEEAFAKALFQFSSPEAMIDLGKEIGIKP